MFLSITNFAFSGTTLRRGVAASCLLFALFPPPLPPPFVPFSRVFRVFSALPLPSPRFLSIGARHCGGCCCFSRSSPSINKFEQLRNLIASRSSILSGIFFFLSNFYSIDQIYNVVFKRSSISISRPLFSLRGIQGLARIDTGAALFTLYWIRRFFSATMRDAP